MRRVLILFATAVILYLSASYWYLPNSPYPAYSLQNFSSFIIRPIGIINHSLNGVGRLFADAKYWFLVRHNLKQRLDNLDKIETELQQARITLNLSQNLINQLVPLTKFSPPQDFKSVTVRTYGSPVGFYDAQLIANAPSGIGLQKDDVAVTLKGLVGRVIETSNRLVRIMLITDMASRVPVKVTATNENAVVVGSGAAVMTLEHLQSREMITNSYKRPPEVGDVLVTSGIGGVFPPDLPVGTVVSIKDDEITVKPFAVFHTLELITILYDHVAL